MENRNLKRKKKIDVLGATIRAIFEITLHAMENDCCAMRYSEGSMLT